MSFPRSLLWAEANRTVPCEPYGWFVVCVEDTSFLTVLMAIFYYVPFALALAIFISLVIKRTTTMLLAMLWLGFLVLLNEGVLKQIIKQPRPHNSCDCTYGMPSGHTVVSMAFLVWIVLEALFDQPAEATGRKNGAWRAIRVLIAFVVFGPVPYSRVHLHYHTPEQIAIGGLLGAGLTVPWFLFLSCLVSPRRWLDLLVLLKPFRFIGFTNDYRPVLVDSGQPADVEPYRSINTDSSGRNYDSVTDYEDGSDSTARQPLTRQNFDPPAD